MLTRDSAPVIVKPVSTGTEEDLWVLNASVSCQNPSIHPLPIPLNSCEGSRRSGGTYPSSLRAKSQPCNGLAVHPGQVANPLQG